MGRVWKLSNYDSDGISCSQDKAKQNTSKSVRVKWSLQSVWDASNARKCQPFR